MGPGDAQAGGGVGASGSVFAGDELLGARARALAMGERGDLGHQEAMTAALREATAEYEVTTREGDEEAHLAAMEAETGAAVALVSTGPSARDKRWRRR